MATMHLRAWLGIRTGKIDFFWFWLKGESTAPYLFEPDRPQLFDLYPSPTLLRGVAVIYANKMTGVVQVSQAKSHRPNVFSENAPVT
jgi:hypothetical protein